VSDGCRLPEEIDVPRSNGELLFEALWEARAFGVAVALHERGAFPWPAFSQALAAQIRQAEDSGRSRPYYESWLAALRELVTDADLISAADIGRRARQVRRQDDHGHDHDHPHGDHHHGQDR
jgi:nitrile hydratase accessory protein